MSVSQTVRSRLPNRLGSGSAWSVEITWRRLQRLQNSGLQRRQIVRNRLPDDLQIDLVIGVAEQLTQIADLPPWHVRHDKGGLRAPGGQPPRRSPEISVPRQRLFWGLRGTVRSSCRG